MKNIYKISLLASTIALLSSCQEVDSLDFQVEKSEAIVKMEELNSYQDLKSYVNRETDPNFKLGAGIDMSDYISQNVMYRLLNRNFDEMSAGYGMKHGAIVQTDGSLNLDNVNKFLSIASESDISVFGHTLAWHANQNASYLNSLLTPLVVNPPAIPNSLDLSGLKNTDFANWDVSNDGGGISVEPNKGLEASAQAVKLISSSGSSNKEELQLITPDIEVNNASTFEIVFYIKSDKPGKGSVTFEGLSNNEPVIDWMGTGTMSETFDISISWQEIRFQVSGFDAETFKAKLNLGYESDVTYYVDVNNFYIYDIDGDVMVSNLVSNSDFENGSSGWGGGWGANDEIGATDDGMGYGNSGKSFFMTNTVSGNFWEAQSNFVFPEYLEVGKTYNLSFMTKAETEGLELISELQSVVDADGNTSYKSNSYGTIYPTTEWTKVELSVTISGENAEFRDRVVFSFGQNAGTVYIDNVILADAAGGTVAEPVIVEKLPEVKTQIINKAFEAWISEMVTNCAPYVKAWDVVNEPMSDWPNQFELKSGIGKTDMASDEFYWQDYLGKDYAVEAFRLTRQYGNPDDILFINDYGLEGGGDKCDGLIQYVEYIESKGQVVDGIGTQMHVTLGETTIENIRDMLTKLAATGKLVKISELDMGIKVGGSTIKTEYVTTDQLQQMSDFYEQIVKAYFEIVPANQRYGITQWAITDSPVDSSWRGGEPIGLWDLDYSRKPAYTGFAKGLSGL